LARKKLILILSIGRVIIATALALGLVFWQPQPPVVVDTVVPAVEILTPQDNGIYYPQQ